MMDLGDRQALPGGNVEAGQHAPPRGLGVEHWARAAVYVVRTFFAVTALISVVSIFGLLGDDLTSRFEVGPVEVTNGAISVEVEAARGLTPITLCPARAVPLQGMTNAFVERRDLNCRQARHMRAYYGPNAYVDESIPVRVRVRDPSSGDKLRLVALQVVLWSSALLAILAIERMLTAASRRVPFARRNVLWMRVVAIAVALNWLVVPLLMRPVASKLLERSGSDYGTSGWKGSTIETRPVWPDNLLWWVVPVAGVLALLALAEVWKSGVALRDDVEATV